jgi:NADPH-dependent 2,4-dienoyl-CoA reductase/sulfur reductase-like enzyme/peroxiredoxin family protein/TusA-related sulfurtransferase/rhodanese-related sulfurtransferase
MKVLIVGGVAGGASVAARLRRLDENAEIIIFEKGKYISFANCGIPYYCGDVIKDREKLLLLTPAQLDAMFNIEARTEAEAIKINRDRKTITVLDRNSDVEYEESYDKLVLSPGAHPVKPPIPGINDERIFTVRNVPDADAIKNFIAKNRAKNAVVIGGGFIGLEMAENLKHAGLNVSLVEGSTQVLAPVDTEIAAQVHNHLRDKGVNLYLFDGVKAFETDRKLAVRLHSDTRIETDIVILAIGVRPESKFAKESGLEVGQTGGILVNEYLQTSDENIWAVGDVIEVKDFVTGQQALIPLAGPANRQGRIAAESICGLDSKYEATQGTAILKVFDLTVASTGSNEKQLSKNNIPYLKTYVSALSHAEYYPNPFPLTIKMLFSPESGKILGSQIIGLDGVDKRIDVIATALKFGGNVSDLAKLELSYAPPYGSAKDPVNLVGMNALNILEGKVKPVHWNDVEKFSNNEHFLLDVRSKAEQITGRLPYTYNIPLEELRNRLSELPTDKKIIVYCNKGKKSYFASRILLQKGFENVYSLIGGYSLYKQVQEDKQHKPGESGYFPDFANIPTDEPEKEIDACGMQCPGPVMKLTQSIKEINQGEVVKIKTTDPGFRKDIQAWCESTGNTLLEVKDENKVITASIQKGAKMIQQKSAIGNGKTLVVFSSDLDKALASFIIANGAAATGNPVTMFFTFWGLNILRKRERPKLKKNIVEKALGRIMPKGPNRLTLSKLNIFGLGTIMMKQVMKSKNVATLTELIEQAQDSGVKFIACQMSMDVMGIKPEELISGVEIGGVATYINAAENSDINLFI